VAKGSDMKKELIKMMIVLTALAALSCENGLYDMADDLDGTVPICVDGDNGSDANDGRGWGNAVATIGQALTLASSGGEIWVKNISAGYTVSASIMVDKPVKIYGGFNGTEIDPGERPAGIKSVLKPEVVTIPFSFFDVDSTGVYFSRIEFSKGTDIGRAINCQSGSSIEIESCDFNELTVTGVNGGAINTASSEVIINNSHFSKNESYYNGGALYSSGGSVILSNSTFNGNNTGDKGGALFFTSSVSVTVQACTFTGNGQADCDQGGAIYAAGASQMVITDSTFDGNSSNSDGGTIYIYGCTADIYDSDFINNESGSTGGVLNVNGYSVINDISIWRCTFKNNTAQRDRGGAIVCNSSDMEIYDSIFQSNIVNGSTAQSCGGGICIMGSMGDEPVKIINTMFYGNSAGGSAYGGAIGIGIISTPASKIVNCTFYMNQASTESGGAVAVGVNSATGATANIYNSLFYGNTDSTGDSSVYRDQGTLNTYNNYWNVIPAGAYTSNGDLAASSIDPFASVTPGDSDFLFLAPGSACINAGTNDLTAIGMTLPSTDLAGNRRIVGGTVDIGAYEKQ